MHSGYALGSKVVSDLVDSQIKSAFQKKKTVDDLDGSILCPLFFLASTHALPVMSSSGEDLQCRREFLNQNLRGRALKLQTWFWSWCQGVSKVLPRIHLSVAIFLRDSRSYALSLASLSSASRQPEV
jgi:hypothetical protein